MKNCRNILAASVLALLLSASALAGEMHTDSPTPPPATSITTQTAATDGEMHTDAATAPAPGTTDPVIKAALELLPTLLAFI